MKTLLKLIFILSLLVTTSFTSEEVPTQEEVAKLYVATFNRAPDSAGLDYWVNNSGLSLSKIAQSFFDQPETQLLYPTSTANRDFVRSVYLNLFNREPDTLGWDYWENELNIGSFSKNSFIQVVINGAQNTDASNDLDILSNKQEVGLYFANQSLEDEIQAKAVLVGVTSDMLSVESAKVSIDDLLNVSTTLSPVITTGEIGTTNFVVEEVSYAFDYMQGIKDGDTMHYVDEVFTSPNDVFSFNLSIPNDDTLYGEVAGLTIPYAGYFTFPTTADNSNETIGVGSYTLDHMQSVKSEFILKESNKKYPLIIYSHGKGDHPFGSNIPTIVKRLAQNGYIVLSLAHGDNRFISLYDLDLANFQEMALRPLSVKTALDIIEADPFFQEIIDFDKIGAMGSSLGGANMWMLAGAKILGPSLFSTRDATSDDRIKAFVGIAPLSGVTYPVFGLSNSIKEVTKPFLVFSNSDDTQIPANNLETAMSSLNYKDNKKLILLADEPHVPSDAGLEIIAQWAVPFYKAYLDSDATAKASYDGATSSSFEAETLIDINK